MLSFNAITAIGTLVRDPELTSTAGDPVCNFSIAMNRKYKRNDEFVEYTSFVEVQVWGKIAEAVTEYLKQGSHVLIHGRLEQDRWKTESGDNRSKHKIHATQVIFLPGGKKPDDEIESPKYDEDVPF